MFFIELCFISNFSNKRGYQRCTTTVILMVYTCNDTMFEGYSDIYVEIAMPTDTSLKGGQYLVFDVRKRCGL